MFNIFKKWFASDKYATHPEAIIISCFFNPQNSPYRIKAFNEFYKSIKHMNHAIIECVIGDAQPQLPENKNITRVYTENLLWHKEALLNKIISELPSKYKYIFWIDADVIFTNKNWMTEGVEQLKSKSIIQPFEHCVHLEQDELKPNFDIELHKPTACNATLRHKSLWRSFCANHITGISGHENYDVHGHVGFAWGARRDVLNRVPLYDKALIGGADHIIAHAAAGQIPHSCITKSFTDNLAEVNDWSKRFYNEVNGRIGYVKGDLYHIWHGDINKRQYLKRIQDFTAKTKQIVNKDKNGLYVTNKGDDKYMKNYFAQREVTRMGVHQDDGFLKSMMLGYLTDDATLGMVLGGNPLGAIIGDGLNTNDEQRIITHDSEHNHITHDSTQNSITHIAEDMATHGSIEQATTHDSNNIESSNFS